jgi:hypothetical protein
MKCWAEQSYIQSITLACSCLQGLALWCHLPPYQCMWIQLYVFVKIGYIYVKAIYAIYTDIKSYRPFMSKSIFLDGLFPWDGFQTRKSCIINQLSVRASMRSCVYSSSKNCVLLFNGVFIAPWCSRRKMTLLPLKPRKPPKNQLIHNSDQHKSTHTQIRETHIFCCCCNSDWWLFANI